MHVAFTGKGQKLSDVSTDIATTKPTSRSRVSNGSALLPNVDGRSRAARRYRDVLDTLIAEYGATSESDLSLCRVAASLSVELEQREAKAIRGETLDLSAMVTAGNLLRRLLRDLAASQRARRRALRTSGATA